jgi:hypothetical protein
MEYKPQQLFLFIFIALIGFGAYILLSMALPLLNSNPFFAIATFGGLAVAIYFAVMYIKSMNTQAKTKLSGMMLMLILLVSGAGVFFTAYAFNVGGTQDVIDSIISPPKQGTRLTVYYAPDENGNTPAPTVYDSSKQKLDSLKIVYGGNTVSSMKIELYMCPSWTSDASVTSYSITGKVQMRIKTSAGSVIYDSGARNLEPSQPPLINGQSVVISSATITASQLESLANMGNGVYIFEYINAEPIKLTINFDNGDSVSASATAPTLNVSFQHTTSGTSRITGLTVGFYKHIN